MKKLLISGLVAFSLWQSLAFSDDTDIYLRQRPPGTEPYLMLTFDYRTDMAATFCNNCANTLQDHPELLAALESIVGEGNSASNIHAVMAVFQVVFAKFNGIYVGLMIPNNDNGGTILRGFRKFVENDENGAKAELLGILNSIPLNGSGNDFFHEVSPKETHYELWRYLNGKTVALGHATAGNFSGGINTAVTNHLKDPPDPYYDTSNPYDSGNRFVENAGLSDKSKHRYISPFSNPNVDYSCVNLFEVYATSGNKGNKDTDLDTQIAADMSAAAAGNDFTGMVSYMARNDLVDDSLAAGVQTMKTWFIQMGSSATLADDWAQAAGTMEQYMNVGGRNVSLADIQTTLESIFIEALSKSSTFVSASVPVNVFNRIQTLDNFYIALFEANSGRVWPGNLKKLRMNDSDGNGVYDDIVDFHGNEAFADEDGRIRYEALTYWTDPLALPPANPDKSEIDLRDGRSVARGGAGQKIPGFINPGTTGVGTTSTSGSRQLFVEPSAAVNGVASDFLPFNADTTTATALQSEIGAASDAEALNVIKWGRGLDVDDEDGDPDTVNRAWVLGDAIHSRPLALNYGATGSYTQGNPNIRLFMGTNDGFFHVFENTTAGGVQSGKELFAFIPRESLPVLKQLRDNTPGQRHPYGVDGEPVAFVADQDLDGTIESGDEVYVYVGMRRGGKSYYALDVSDPDAQPKLQWKIDNNTSGFGELGWTFSTPRVGKVQFATETKDVLIFAGGYDRNKDTPKVADLANPEDSIGNAIYIVDARTGALIWKAVGGSGTNTNSVFYHSELQHSIPSTVATLDSNSNGIIDRAYVGDTGGSVWRIDLPEGTESDHRLNNWSISKFADLSGATEGDDRRFFHPPDIVQTKDSSGPYDGVLIASGDRANPLETDDGNFLYLIKDRHITSGSPSTRPLLHSEITDTTGCVSGTETVDGVNCDSLDYGNGWKVELTQSGEKGLASPLTIDGKVYFTTYRPEALGSSCDPVEGMGALYLVNLKDGTAVSTRRDQEIGPGIPPQVTALGDSALIVPGSGVLESPDSLERTKLVDVDGKSMYIIYWREPGVDDL